MRTNDAGGASPFASQVTVEAEGQHTVEYRSADKAGNAETAKTVAFGIDIPDPGFPVIQAFADPTAGTGPAAGPLLRHRATIPTAAQLSYKWEFANGAVFGRGVDADLHASRVRTPAKVTATDDEGDKTSQGGHGHGDARRASSRRPSRPRVDRHHGRAGPLAVKFTATGTDPDGPTTTCSCTSGSSVTAAARSPRTRPHVYIAAGRATPPSVTVSDGSGATATKTITITVTDAPGNQAPVFEDGADPRSGATATRWRSRSRAEAKDPNGDTVTLRVGLRRRLGEGQPAASSKHTYTSAGHLRRHGDRHRRQGRLDDRRP